MSDAAYTDSGCSFRHDPERISIVIVAHGPDVIEHDLSRGIPLPDASCDVVYHSAALDSPATLPMRRPSRLNAIGC